MKRITRKQVEEKLATARPHLVLHEVNGRKGVYRKDAGPAASFMTIGKTWKDVAAWLEN